MKLNKKFKIILLCALALSGCAPVTRNQLENLLIAPNYQGPSDKNDKNIAYFNLAPIENKNIDRVKIYFYKNSDDCSGISEVPGSWINDSKRSPIKIGANRKITFSIYSYISTFTYCYLTATFLPVTNKSYIAYLDYDGDKCFVAVEEAENGQLTPVKLNVRKPSKPMFENGAFCQPEHYPNKFSKFVGTFLDIVTS